MKLLRYLLFPLCLFMACSDDDDPEILPPTPEDTEIVVTPSIKGMLPDMDIQLSATLSGDVAGLSVQWVSTNKDVAAVNEDGQVKAIAQGEAFIIASIQLADTVKQDTCIIRVYQPTSYQYKYRLMLKDKGKIAYSVNKPEEYLSAKAIQRRNNQNIAIDERDLPLSGEYLKAIEAVGGVIVAKSKWLNTVTVHCTHEYMKDDYAGLPFVEGVKMVWCSSPYGNAQSIGRDKFSVVYDEAPAAASRFQQSEYGQAWRNIVQHNGDVLHQAGYKGAGITIAVIDAGYNNVKNIAAFNSTNIKGAKSFIYNNDNIYSNANTHGQEVLSCMAANIPGTYIGTAPEADYWLFRTEDVSSEYPVEEDYWVAAMEYADSIGVDITTTSLGYVYFDRPAVSYTAADMDGTKALASYVAEIASEKGIFVVCSAGNDGNNHFVGAPSDARNILTVGAVQTNGSISGFSSAGMTADGRMKPEVVALGTSTCLINTNGTVSYSNGTSYSTPVMCGLVACLWQAYPSLTVKELLDVIIASSNRYNLPVLPYGYGLPDMQKAMQLAQSKAK